MPNAKLTLADITDQRAYEREREQFRAHVIELKKRRRVGVGPVITFLFENRETIRFQIQEMARVERIITDEGIQAELDVYNPLIPEPGALAATMFIELTNPDELREWLPKLAGVERAVSIRLGEGDSADTIPARLDAGHESTLTRDEVTASVHYLHWTLSPEQVERIGSDRAALVVDHPAYQHETVLDAATTAELLSDLR